MISETIEDIKKRLVLTLLSTPPFLTINMSPSNVALWSKFLDVVATEMHHQQDLLSEYESEIEALMSRVTTPTDQWWQKKALEFQYSSDPLNQQIAILDTNNFYVYYPNGVKPALQIIKNASAKTDNNNIIQVKVTKGGAVLDPSELAAFKAYCETFCPAGVRFNVINELPDRLWLDADIYFNGQYDAVIQANVISALNSFLKSIPFNGIVKISEIEDAIQEVEGVTDVVINSVAARRLITPFANKAILSRYWQTYSGEIVQEDETGQTFSDTLKFHAE